MYRNTAEGPKRGVAIYSYSAEYGLTKTLEECFEEIKDMGAHGIEILANTHIDNYPYPTDEWVNNWRRLCDQYEVEPAEYGHWIDSKGLGGIEHELTTEESIAMLKRDIRLAHRLGFKVLRTKMPVITEKLEPVTNWKEIINGALPLAERLGIKMCPEIHTPSNLKGEMVQQYVDFIKETGTKNFGLNIDFSVFRTEFSIGEWKDPAFTPNEPEDIIPLLPYVYCCHAKFININDDFEETTIPYKRVLEVLRENGYNGYLLSEYEGADKYDYGVEVGQILRKHQILMKNILGV